MTNEELIDAKWDAIHSAMTTMSSVRNDLFDDVALALSRIEGKLSFLNSLDHEGESRIVDGHSQSVGAEAQQELSEARSALNKICADLTEGKLELYRLDY